MIEESSLKVGKKYKGLVNGDVFEIIKIEEIQNDTYITVECNNKAHTTNIKTFCHLLIKEI